MNYEELAKTLILIGGIILALGILFFLLGKILPGRLPGDIFIKKGNVSFFFPITTCIIMSIILTLIFNLFRR